MEGILSTDRREIALIGVWVKIYNRDKSGKLFLDSQLRQMCRNTGGFTTNLQMFVN